MTELSDHVNVSRDDEQSRYEIYVGDVLGGYAEFVPDDRGRLVFPDTQIDPAFKGRGLGTKLVAAAMTDAAERGDTVVPDCPFVVRYLRENDVPGLDIDWSRAPADTDA